MSCLEPRSGENETTSSRLDKAIRVVVEARDGKAYVPMSNLEQLPPSCAGSMPSYQYGGLFCSREDATLLRLAFSFPEKAQTAPDDASTFSFLSHLYATTVTSYTPTPLSHSADSEEECKSAAMARGLRDVSRGMIVIKVPHLCVPWGRKLGEILWKRLGVRLERWSGSRRWEGIGVGVPVQIGEDMWPELKGDAREYNYVVINHLEKRWGLGILKKVANLVRLDFVNNMLRDIERLLVRISDDEDDVKQQMKQDRIKGELVKPLKMRAKNCVTVGAFAVRKSGLRRGRSAPERYIVNGTLVPSNIFAEFRSVLMNDFAILVECVERPSARPHYDVDEYMEQLGTDWVTVAESALITARRKEVLTRANALREDRKRMIFVEDQYSMIRKSLIEKAIVFESAGTSLTKMCALKVAQQRLDRKVAALYKYMPREVWKRIDSASRRLEELEDAIPVSPNSFAPL